MPGKQRYRYGFFARWQTPDDDDRLREARGAKMRRRPQEGFDWRALLGRRLVTAEEAISRVNSGDRASISLALQTRRRDEWSSGYTSNRSQRAQER
jgi:hypothetical protein